ncbi:DUF5994 family protein [Streptomyces griseorubiginosus]|uniref:DUF5994 family protein n=1 Tax=Streptomyces griseorubiginosus TaxID=67304 RepID=UPI00365E5878
MAPQGRNRCLPRVRGHRQPSGLPNGVRSRRGIRGRPYTVTLRAPAPGENPPAHPVQRTAGGAAWTAPGSARTPALRQRAHPATRFTGPAAPLVPSPARLALRPPTFPPAPVSGWWPRSDDLAAELPALVEAFDGSWGRVLLIARTASVRRRHGSAARVPSRTTERADEWNAGSCPNPHTTRPPPIESPTSSGRKRPSPGLRKAPSRTRSRRAPYCPRPRRAHRPQPSTRRQRESKSDARRAPAGRRRQPQDSSAR